MMQNGPQQRTNGVSALTAQFTQMQVSDPNETHVGYILKSSLNSRDVDILTGIRTSLTRAYFTNNNNNHHNYHIITTPDSGYHMTYGQSAYYAPYDNTQKVTVNKEAAHIAQDFNQLYENLQRFFRGVHTSFEAEVVGFDISEKGFIFLKLRPQGDYATAVHRAYQAAHQDLQSRNRRVNLALNQYYRDTNAAPVFHISIGQLIPKRKTANYSDEPSFKSEKVALLRELQSIFSSQRLGNTRFLFNQPSLSASYKAHGKYVTLHQKALASTQSMPNNYTPVASSRQPDVASSSNTNNAAASHSIQANAPYDRPVDSIEQLRHVVSRFDTSQTSLNVSHITEEVHNGIDYYYIHFGDNPTGAKRSFMRHFNNVFQDTPGGSGVCYIIKDTKIILMDRQAANNLVSDPHGMKRKARMANQNRLQNVVSRFDTNQASLNVSHITEEVHNGKDYYYIHFGDNPTGAKRSFMRHFNNVFQNTPGGSGVCYIIKDTKIILMDRQAANNLVSDPHGMKRKATRLSR